MYRRKWGVVQITISLFMSSVVLHNGRVLVIWGPSQSQIVRVTGQYEAEIETRTAIKANGGLHNFRIG